MSRGRWTRADWALVLLACAVGCGGDPRDGNGGDEAADGDADIDGDSDADGDVRADAGAEADADSDGDCDPDRDRHDSPACGGDDCDDRRDDVFPGAPEGWSAVPLDRDAAASSDTSLVVGVDGTLHVAYGAGPRCGEECGDVDLRYATVDGETFDIEVVDDEGSTGARAALALDAAGAAHVTYTGDQLTLRYATNATGEWVLSTLDETLFSGGRSDIEVDDDGVVHVAYFRIGEIWYARITDGSFASELVEAVPASEPSLAMDLGPDRAVHLVFASGEELRHAVMGADGWAIEVLRTRPGDITGGYADVAVDQDGTVHVVFFDWSSEGVLHATNASGAWEMETVDDSWGAGAFMALALDGQGAVHVAYYADTLFMDGELRYATNASGSFVVETVEADGWVGHGPSLALEGDDVWLTYRDLTDDEVRLAFRSGPDAIDNDCDGVAE